MISGVVMLRLKSMISSRQMASLYHGKIVQYVPNKNLTFKEPNTTIADFAHTVDPNETAQNELSHLDLQCCLL